MKQFLVTFFFLSTIIAFCQDKEEQMFFNTILNKEVYYVNKNSFVNNQLTEQVINLINTKTLYSRDMFIEDKIELTDLEVEYLVKELLKNTNLKSKKYLKGYSKLKMFSLIKPSKKVYKSFYSKPIFFRDNSLCLIYISSYKGHENAGGGWKLYKKVNDNWKYLFYVTNWIS